MSFQPCRKTGRASRFLTSSSTLRKEGKKLTTIVGEATPFPGKDPLTGRAIPPAQLISPEEAASTRKQIETLWLNRWNRKSYQPQMGWNDATGEPHMAVRAYAENSYPALSGDRHSFLKKVQRLMPEFVLQYERFPHLGYTLIVSAFSFLDLE